jgi:hypothetical protein
VGLENPVRFIDASVRSLDLRQVGFERAVALDTGRPPYDPGDLLALYIYGSSIGGLAKGTDQMHFFRLRLPGGLGNYLQACLAGR